MYSKLCQPGLSRGCVDFFVISMHIAVNRGSALPKKATIQSTGKFQQFKDDFFVQS